MNNTLTKQFHRHGNNSREPFLHTTPRGGRGGNFQRGANRRHNRKSRGPKRIQQEIELSSRYRPPGAVSVSPSVVQGVPVVPLPQQKLLTGSYSTIPWEKPVTGRNNSTNRGHEARSFPTRRHLLRNDNPAEQLVQPLFSNGICCLQCVRTQEVGIVETCGAFEEIVGPGIYTGGCWPCTVIVSRLSLRVQQMDIKMESKTKDNVFVFVTVSIQFRVVLERAYDAYYSLMDVRRQIKTYVFDVIRSTLPRMDLDNLFSTKSEISDLVFTYLQRTMKEYGYEIVSSLMTKIEPNDGVKESMNEVVASRSWKEAMHHKAEADKFVRVKAAEATLQRMFLHGVGISKQRAAIADSLKGSLTQYSAENGHSTTAAIDLILFSQYIDMLVAVGARDLIIGATMSTQFPSRNEL